MILLVKHNHDVREVGALNWLMAVLLVRFAIKKMFYNLPSVKPVVTLMYTRNYYYKKFVVKLPKFC